MWSRARPAAAARTSGRVIASLDLEGAPAAFSAAELWFRGVAKTESSFEIQVTLERAGQRALAGSLFTYGEGPARGAAVPGGPAGAPEGMNLHLDVARALRALLGRSGLLDVVLAYADQHGRPVVTTDFACREVALIVKD
jgi:hypothetical protein